MSEDEKQLVKKFKNLYIKDFNNEHITSTDRLSYIECALLTELIEKLEKELEKYKELYVRTLGHTLNNSITQSNKEKDNLEALNEGWKIELEKKDKIINAMADSLSEEGYYADKCQSKIEADECDENCKNCIKQYFEKKVNRYAFK